MNYSEFEETLFILKKKPSDAAKATGVSTATLSAWKKVTTRQRKKGRSLSRSTLKKNVNASAFLPESRIRKDIPSKKSRS